MTKHKKSGQSQNSRSAEESSIKKAMNIYSPGQIGPKNHSAVKASAGKTCGTSDGKPRFSDSHSDKKMPNKEGNYKNAYKNTDESREREMKMQPNSQTELELQNQLFEVDRKLSFIREFRKNSMLNAGTQETTEQEIYEDEDLYKWYNNLSDVEKEDAFNNTHKERGDLLAKINKLFPQQR